MTMRRLAPAAGRAAAALALAALALLTSAVAFGGDSPAAGGSLAADLAGEVGGVPFAVFLVEGLPARTVLLVRTLAPGDDPASAAAAWRATLPSDALARPLAADACIQAQWSRPVARGDAPAWWREVEAHAGHAAGDGRAFALVEAPAGDAALFVGAGLRRAHPAVVARWPAPLAEEARLAPGSMRVAAPEQGAPAWRVAVEGPAYGTLDGEALLLLGAALGEDPAAPAARVRLTRGRWWLDLIGPGAAPAPDDAAVRALLAGVQRAAARRPDAAALARLRDQMRLRRLLAFEVPGARLDFVARRLRSAGWEALLGEEARLDAVTPEAWRTAMARWLDHPSAEVVIAAAPAGEGVPPVPEEEPLRIERRAGFTLLARRSQGPLASVCVLEALPGPEATGAAGGAAAAPPLVREEAAAAWRARLVAALNRHPDAAARLAVAAPSPLPGAQPDPFGSNQFVGVSLQAARAHSGDLLLVLGDLLGAASPPRWARDLVREEQRALARDDVARAAWHAALEEQASLYPGAAGAALFARRRALVEALLERGRAATPSVRWDLAASADRVVVAIDGPPVDDALIEYLERRLTRAAEAGEEAPASGGVPAGWAVPSGAERFAPGAPRRFVVALGGEPRRHATALLLAQLAAAEARRAAAGAWTFSVYEFRDDAALLAVAPGSWPDQGAAAADRAAVRGVFARVAAGGAASPSAFAALRGAALDARARGAAPAARTTFGWARHQLLFLDPLRNGRLTQALVAAAEEDVRALAAEVAGRLGGEAE